MNQLPNRGFPAAFARISPVRDVAVEIFRDRDLGRKRAPTLWDFDVFLLENDLATVVGDLRRAPFPFDLIEWRNGWITENARHAQPAILLSGQPICSAIG